MAKERIGYEIPVDDKNPNDTQYEMWIQGKRIAIPRGKEVEVEPIVKDIYKETTQLARKANKAHKELVVFKEPTN